MCSLTVGQFWTAFVGKKRKEIQAEHRGGHAKKKGEKFMFWIRTWVMLLITTIKKELEKSVLASKDECGLVSTLQLTNYWRLICK